MNIILSENVNGLGKMGDSVTVAKGYARNFLLPQKLAVIASKQSIRHIEHQKAIIAKKILKEKSQAEAVALQLSKLSLSFTVKAGEEGKLFGSIGLKDIVNELSVQGFDLGKKAVILEKPIKELGVFFIPVKIQHNVTGNVKVEIVPEEESTETNEPVETAESNTETTE